MGDEPSVQLAYKDESEMIDLASSIGDSEVCFYPAESDLAHRFLTSLRDGGFSQRERPDFEDLGSSLLLEAMIVDDHPRPRKKDRTRAREGEVLREIKALGLELHSDVKLVANVSSGLPTDQDHNYRAYVSQFERTVLEHGDKVGAYRAERPGFDLGFLVLDESTAYFETSGASELTHFGGAHQGRPLFWFADATFAEIVAASGADYFVWLTPYKRLLSTAGEFPLPAMTILDVTMLGQERHIVHDPQLMVSAET